MYCLDDEEIFRLPTTIDGVCEFTTSTWIKKNDSSTELSRLKVEHGCCFVPLDIYEDMEANTDEARRLDAMLKSKTGNVVVFPAAALQLIQQVRIQAYDVCEWIQELGPIPTAHTQVLQPPRDGDGGETPSWTVASATEAINRAKKPLLHGSQSFFARTCKASPKDIIKCPTFQSAEAVLQVFSASRRTKETWCASCLVLRELRDFAWEVRCYWSKRRLTAVSLDEDSIDEQCRARILEFFQRYGDSIPFNSAVVDIGLVRDTNKIELIEFNPFGPDLPATSEVLNT